MMKKVLITGANGALGRHVTRKLLEDRWHVHAAVASGKSNEELRGLFPEYYGQHLTATVADITRRAEVDKLITHAGNISGLVHLAGGFRGAKEIAASAEDDFNFLFNLHAKATFYLLSAAMPVFKRSGAGSIVTIGAKPAIHPGKENAVYAASKAAELSFTLTVAEEGRADNIRANCIVPAVIRTPANAAGADPSETMKWTPPQDIANLISYLLSDAANGITGSVIPMYNKLHS